jgi:hypothetical protein
MKRIAFGRQQWVSLSETHPYYPRLHAGAGRDGSGVVQQAGWGEAGMC